MIIRDGKVYGREWDSLRMEGTKMSDIRQIITGLEKYGRINAEDIPDVIERLKASVTPVTVTKESQILQEVNLAFAEVDRRQQCIDGQSSLPNGCTLYWETGVMGNRIYSSDEIGGGVHVWDVCLVDQGTLLAAMTKELELQTFERHMKERK